MKIYGILISFSLFPPAKIFRLSVQETRNVNLDNEEKRSSQKVEIRKAEIFPPSLSSPVVSLKN